MLDCNKMPEGLQGWMDAGGNGASAKSIVAHLAGVGEQYGDYPHDGGDFGRCEALLEAVPAFADDLHRMAEVNDYWKALVERWGEIAASSDKYQLISEIVRPIQKADPHHLPFGENAHIRVGPNTFKETDADREVKDKAYRVTANELRQFVERFERLEAEKKDLADQQKEVMSEAKARGYDTKVLRKVVALRKRDKDDIAEEQAVLDLYLEALGM